MDETKTNRFLLKGGTLLQHRLGGIARATKDVDGMVCGDIDDFLVDMGWLRKPVSRPVHPFSQPS
jgi:hypothetical protein